MHIIFKFSYFHISKLIFWAPFPAFRSYSSVAAPLRSAAPSGVTAAIRGAGESFIKILNDKKVGLKLVWSSISCLISHI